MTFALFAGPLRWGVTTTTERGVTRRALRERYDRATADLDPPFAIVDLAAFDANASALVGRAGGKPLRVPSKSVRCRALIDRVLGRPGWRGIMAYTLSEALWLNESPGQVNQQVNHDALVAYPTAERAALTRLAADEALAAKVTLMVDDVRQLDFIDSVVPPARRAAPLRLCLDLDASWRPGRGRVHIGVRRSPIHTPRQAGALAAAVGARPGFRLVGLMSYEAQIAGLGDAPPGQPLRGALIRAMQAGSFPELLARRAAVVAEVRRHADLEFVNGGGTGSVAGTASDPAVTEVAAGSGLYGPWLFDGYRRWRPQPAALFALSVVRRPNPRTATVQGGGWIASGEAAPSRQPLPWLPGGLKLIGTEGRRRGADPGRRPGRRRAADR